MQSNYEAIFSLSKYDLWMRSKFMNVYSVKRAKQKESEISFHSNQIT